MKYEVKKFLISIKYMIENEFEKREILGGQGPGRPGPAHLV